MQNIDKLQNAEKSYRKAIELNTNYSEAYSNLGIILSELGKFRGSEVICHFFLELPI